MAREVPIFIFNGLLESGKTTMIARFLQNPQITEDKKVLLITATDDKEGNSTVAKNIVDFRDENGEFKERSQLKKVPKLGAKAFEQCAGFMRITGGKNPLDATSVHPESYGAAEKLIERLGYTEEDIVKGGLKGIAKKVHNPKKLAEELGIGEITLEAIGSINDRYGDVPKGEYAIGYGAWGGAAFYPFRNFQVYMDPDQYDINEAANWDPKTEELTLTVNGEEELPEYLQDVLNIYIKPKISVTKKG